MKIIDKLTVKTVTVFRSRISNKFPKGLFHEKISLITKKGLDVLMDGQQEVRKTFALRENKCIQTCAAGDLLSQALAGGSRPLQSDSYRVGSLGVNRRANEKLTHKRPFIPSVR